MQQGYFKFGASMLIQDQKLIVNYQVHDLKLGLYEFTPNNSSKLTFQEDFQGLRIFEDGYYH